MNVVFFVVFVILQMYFNCKKTMNKNRLSGELYTLNCRIISLLSFFSLSPSFDSNTIRQTDRLAESNFFVA